MRSTNLNILAFCLLFVMSFYSLAQEQQGQGEAEKAFIQSIKDKALSGDVDAQQKIGMLYLQGGYGVVRDEKAAIKWLEMAAKQHVVFAEYMLGVIYQSQKNYTKSQEWHEKAAAKGYESSQLALGDMYQAGNGFNQNYTKAAHWYLLAANKGLAEAQFYLGQLYHLGKGVPLDYTEAIKWYVKAANQNTVEAQVSLYLLYSDEKTDVHDHKAATVWLIKAADYGQSTAQYILGGLYHEGTKVPQDNILALKYFYLASAQGLEEANVGINLMAEELTDAQIAKAQNMAREWIKEYKKGKS